MSRLTTNQKMLKAFVSKDEIRLSMNHIGVQNGRLYATDGHRAYSCKDIEHPDGVARLDVFLNSYQVMLDKSFGTYPNMKQITPALTDKWTVIDWHSDACQWLGEIKGRKTATIGFTRKGMTIGASEGALSYFDARLLAPLVKHRGDDTLRVFIKDSLSPAVFTDVAEAKKGLDPYLWTWFAIVMPMRAPSGRLVDVVSEWEK